MILKRAVNKFAKSSLLYHVSILLIFIKCTPHPTYPALVLTLPSLHFPPHLDNLPQCPLTYSVLTPSLSFSLISYLSRLCFLWSDFSPNSVRPSAGFLVPIGLLGIMPMGVFLYSESFSFWCLCDIMCNLCKTTFVCISAMHRLNCVSVVKMPLNHVVPDQGLDFPCDR